MKKFKKKLTNSIDGANWSNVKPTNAGNPTTNSVITPAMFKLECKEYDAGILPFEHERYIGEIYE